jgi:hypothetical protein
MDALAHELLEKETLDDVEVEAILSKTRALRGVPTDAEATPAA